MEAITFLRKKYCIPSNKTLEESKVPPQSWYELIALLNDFQIQIKNSILIEVNKGFNENWNKMGSTGNDEWQKKLEDLKEFGGEVFHFGKFDAYDGIKSFLEESFLNK